MIRSLDPGDDRDPGLFSGPSAIAVQDVLLDEGEGGLHRGVDSGSTYLAHRADEVITVQGVHELP